jgi:stage V sporulation protein G
VEITDIRVRKLNPPGPSAGKMRAIVSVTFNSAFVVHDIKVIQNEDKFFIAMPSRQIEDGTYKDIAHPIRAELRNMLQTVVIERYEAAMADAAQSAEIDGT